MQIWVKHVKADGFLEKQKKNNLAVEDIQWLEGQNLNPHNSQCVKQYIYFWTPWARLSIPALPIRFDTLARKELEIALPYNKNVAKFK